MSIYRPPRPFILDKDVVIPNAKNGYYSVYEAAEIAHVSPTYIIRHVNKGDIKSVRLGKHTYIHKTEIPHITSMRKLKAANKAE